MLYKQGMMVMQYTLRLAKISDIKNILKLEKKWGDSGANEDQIRSRIKTFPEGCPVIVDPEGNVIVSGFFQFCGDVEDDDSYKNDDGFITWDSVTGNGMMKHDPDGKCIYGISLTASGNRFNLGSLVLEYAISVLYTEKMEKFYLGSRLPGLSEAFTENADLSANQYVKDGDDPLLKFYLEKKFIVLETLSNYFYDPDSQNYGVLIRLENNLLENRVINLEKKEVIQLGGEDGDDKVMLDV